jgi:hypothetical protein
MATRPVSTSTSTTAAARPRHRRRRVELRGPEPRAAELHQTPIGERHARDLGERDRAPRRADHERTAVLDPHVVRRAFEETRGDATRLHLHVRRRDRDRVAGVHRDPAGAGSVAEGHQRRVAAAHADVVEGGAEVLRAHLGEDRLVSLTRARHPDEHLDVTAIVDLHGRPLAGPHAASGFEVSCDPQADPPALGAQVPLALPPARVVDQLERPPELERVVAAVVADDDAVAVHEAGPVGHFRRRDLVSRADLGGIEAERGREPIEQTLDHQDRLGPPSPSVRRARRLVGDHG